MDKTITLHTFWVGGYQAHLNLRPDGTVELTCAWPLDVERLAMNSLRIYPAESTVVQTLTDAEIPVAR
jgi:hypothetical protein